MSDNDLLFLDDDEQVEESLPWRILVVDDDPDVHATTRFSLERFRFCGRGVEIFSAFSGREALDMVRANLGQYDLALIDVVMETPTDGLDAAREIRERLECAKIPYIIIRSGQPAYSRPEDVLGLPQVDAYLSKAQLPMNVLHDAVSRGLAAAAAARGGGAAANSA